MGLLNRNRSFLALSFLFGSPTFLAFLVAQRFTHPPWYYETSRTPLQGLNFGWGSVNWLNGKTNPLADFNVSYNDVEFSGPFGSTLRGWYVPGPANSTRGIVAVHGAGLDRREFLKLVPALNAAGYHMLLFDCREHGISTGSLRGFSYGIREHSDVISAVKYFRDFYKLKKVGVIATSQGATSTILAASKEDGIDAAILENPFASLDELLTDVIDGILNSKPDWAGETGAAGIMVSLGDYIPAWYRNFIKHVTMWKVIYLANEGSLLNAVDVVGKLNRPIFLIHGTADSLIPLKHTLKLFETAREPKMLWVAEGCEHAAIYNKYPEEYVSKITTFLQQYL